jgi:hypothetical protein
VSDAGRSSPQSRRTTSGGRDARRDRPGPRAARGLACHVGAEVAPYAPAGRSGRFLSARPQSHGRRFSVAKEGAGIAWRNVALLEVQERSSTRWSCCSWRSLPGSARGRASPQVGAIWRRSSG